MVPETEPDGAGTLPRVVIAGTGSGVGKTSVACGAIRGLKRMGYSVQPFKAGPDYIDPGHLAVAAGRAACNLDVWLMGRGGAVESFARNSGSDVSVIEGVMGFYDGFDGIGDLASTHQVARITGSSTILVVDAGGAARSVAATILGFVKFSRKSTIRAVILNNVGSSRHESLCRSAIEPLGIPVVGAIPRNSEVAFESRHLGLVPAAEDEKVREDVRRSSDAMADHIDMDALLEIARSAPPIKRYPPPKKRKNRAAIGVALDGSFNFYYKDNLDRLRDAGARLEFFSPESSDTLPEVDGLYIGGGFPEVRGDRLGRNLPMLKAIKDKAQSGAPVYAECGGLMYLVRSIRRGDERFDMVGLFDAEAVMTGRVILNYTSGVMHAGPIARVPAKFRGHEFHYSKLEGVASDSKFAQTLDLGQGIIDGKDGLLVYDTLASYGHLYLGRSAAGNMVDRCAKLSRK